MLGLVVAGVAGSYRFGEEIDYEWVRYAWTASFLFFVFPVGT